MKEFFSSFSHSSSSFRASSATSDSLYACRQSRVLGAGGKGKGGVRGRRP